MSIRSLMILLSFACGSPVAICLAEAPAAGQQTEQKFVTTDSAEMPYLLYLPEQYEAGQESWPLIFFLHGRGESNGPLSLVTKWGPPRMAARGDQLPYIVVSPQCPQDDSWRNQSQQSRLVELLDWIVKSYDVDEDRIYLTGLSMGGAGSWRMAADHPSRFAAVVPICGGGEGVDLSNLTRLPIWVFIGDEDRRFEENLAMVDAIKSHGSQTIRLTTLENIGHNCWSAAYATPGLYTWLDEQSRANDKQSDK